MSVRVFAKPTNWWFQRVLMTLTIAASATALVQIIGCGEQNAGREASYGIHSAMVGQPEAAIGAIDRATATDPANAGPGALEARAIAYEELDDNQEALRSLDQAIHLASARSDPKFRIANLYMERGHVYCKLARYDHAIQDADSAISLKDTMMAECSKIAADILTCKQASAGMVGLFYGLRAYAEGGLGHYDLAQNDLQIGMRSAPDDEELYYYQGLVYRRLGNSKLAEVALEKSAAQFDQLIASDTAPASVYSCQQAVVLFALGRDAGAQRSFDRCYTSLSKAGSPQMIPRYRRLADLAKSHPTWPPTYW